MNVAIDDEGLGENLKSRFKLTPLTPSIGAEIRGIDVKRDLDESTFIALRDAIHRYCVVVVRDQNMSANDELAFVKRLGPVRKERYSKFFVPDVPELMILSNIIEDGHPIGAMDVGGLWHTDKLHTPYPNMYTILYGLKIPKKDGKALGSTWFANVADAYDALPDSMKKKLLPLTAVHNLSCSLERKAQKNVLNKTLLTATDKVAQREAEHPIISVHPITGRKCVMATEGHTARIKGMTADESDRLLRELWTHIIKPEFVCEHRWEVGDLLIWDNRSSQHLATFDYGDIPRLIYRGETWGPALQSPDGRGGLSNH